MLRFEALVEVHPKGHDRADQCKNKVAPIATRRTKQKWKISKQRQGKAEHASTSGHIRDHKCLLPEACILEGAFVIIFL